VTTSRQCRAGTLHLTVTTSHRLLALRSSVYETVERPSVCLSVCLSHHPTAAAACGGFAAERRVHRMYRSIAAAAGRPAAASPQHGAQQQLRAESRVTDDVVN